MTSFVTNVSDANETEFSEFNSVFGRGGLVGITDIEQVLKTVVGDDWLANVNMNVRKHTFRAFVPQRKLNRLYHSYNGYEYYLRRNKTKMSTCSKPAIIDFGKISISPDGVYRWIMYSTDRSIRICCKQVYPVLPFVSSQKNVIRELLDTLPTGQPIMVLGGGEFIKYTKFENGLPSYRFTINTIPDDSIKMTVLSAHDNVDKFFLFVFTRLGPQPDKALAFYRASESEESFIGTLPGISLLDTRCRLLEYSNMYGYTVYEFGPSPQHRSAFKRVNPIVFARFNERMRQISRTTDVLRRLRVDHNPGVVTPAQYKQQQKVHLLAQTNMLNNRELARFKLSLYHWQTMVTLRNSTIHFACDHLFAHLSDDDQTDVMDKVMTPIRQAVVLGMNPLRVGLEFVAV
jgi:hypothetical protein